MVRRLSLRTAGLVVIIGLAGLPSPPLAATYIVRPDGTGDFPTIQAAIDAATGGDLIELSDGTFTGVGNREIDYLGKAIIVRSQGGGPDACVIDCQGSESEPHRGFWFHSGEDARARLEGVRIIHGYGSADATQDYRHGGGIDCDQSAPTISGCAIAACVAGNAGGGIACWQSSPILETCAFEGDFAERGAALFCRESSNPALSGCVFSNNVAEGAAGAIFLWTGCSPTLTRCSFSDNHGGLEGGAIRFSGGAPSLSECVFSGNAAMFGGALLASGSVGPTFIRCTFDGNTAHRGGAIESYQSSPVLRECMLRDNQAEYAGGAIYAWLGEAELTFCTLQHNVSERGGGLCARECTASMVNCTLYGNSAGLEGGGLRCSDGSVIGIEHTIIAFGEEGAAIHLTDESSSVSLSCCDLFGNAGGDWVGAIADQYGIDGNISADPLFCDPSIADLTLREDSPCAPFSPYNPECDLTGAWPVGCSGTATLRMSWGSLKALFSR